MARTNFENLRVYKLSEELSDDFDRSACMEPFCS